MKFFSQKKEPPEPIPDKSPDARKGPERRPIINISTVADEIIAEAMRDGAFDNLPGRGRPLELAKSPYGQENELAHKLLKDNNFTLPWITDRAEMQQKIEQARAEISRRWQIHRIALGRTATSEGQAALIYSWRHTLAELAEELQALNKAIAKVNIGLPHSRFELIKLNLDYELERIGAGRDLISPPASE
jgi:DnaJ family protein C protein 28